MKTISVQIVDVDFWENLLVDNRWVGKISCNLRLVRPPQPPPQALGYLPKEDYLVPLSSPFFWEEF